MLWKQSQIICFTIYSGDAIRSLVVIWYKLHKTPIESRQHIANALTTHFSEDMHFFKTTNDVDVLKQAQVDTNSTSTMA